MKRFLFLLLCLPVVTFGQFRMVSSTVTLDSTVNDSTYIISVNFFSDQTAKGYFASGITADYRVFSQTGQLYDITAASNLTLSSGELTIVEIDNNYVDTELAPTGQILVFDPQGEYITYTPFGNSNMGQVLQQAIGTYNAVVSSNTSGTGIAAWDSTETYEQFQQVSQAGKIYTNRTGDNSATLPGSDPVNWEVTNKSAITDDIDGRDTLSQLSHPFDVGDPLWYSGDYLLSRDTGNSVRVDGIVVEVIDANTFVRQRSGKFTLSSHGFTNDIQLYVQPDGTYSTADTSNSLVYGFAINANEIQIGIRPTGAASIASIDKKLVWNQLGKYKKYSIVNYQGDYYEALDTVIGERPDTSSKWIVKTVENPASTAYVDGIDRLKTSFKSSIQNPRYSTNDIIKLRDNNAEFQILRSISSTETVDSIFITEVYDTSLTTENLFLLSEDFPRPFPYPWRPSGGGTDIAFEKDVMLSPLGTFTADKATKTVSSLVRQYMQDTIFANTTYYLSFWFRAGDGMATSGVEMDDIRFLNNGSNYTDPVTISLTTSDTLWRYYEVAMEQSDIDLLPTGATGADWGCRFDGMPNPSEFSIWGMSLSRNPSEEYIRTTDTKTAKRYRGFSKLITSSQTLELDRLPEYIGVTDDQILKNDTKRLQAAYDYCAEGICDYIDIGKGLTIDSTINVRDGITLIGRWSGDIELDDQDPRITVDLNDSTATAFRVIPDSGNPIPLGASFKNIYFDVISPVNIVIDMGSTNKSTVENILIQGDKQAKTNLRYGREEYLTGQRYGAIGNTNRNVKLFQATEQALLLDSIGALNFFYESQFHRSKIGIKAENSSLNCYGCHIEKSDSLALVFNGGALYWLGGYTESPNYDPGLGGSEVGDTIAFHIKKATIAEFKNSSFSTSSETKVYFDVDEDVEEFNLERNYFSGGTLDRLIDINEYATKFEKNGNVFFAPGVMENTIPPDQIRDITNIYPSLIEGSTNRTTNQNTIIRDSVAFSNAILRSKVNHIANSEALDSTASFDFNPSRLTLTTDDVANPIDSSVTADKLTLTADVQAKLFNIIPSGLTFETYTRYNLSFWIRPGTESFNDNIVVTIAGSEIIQSDTLRSFDPSLKEWQRIDTVIVFTETPASNQISLRFYGDASDYFWFTGVQVTQGETVVDYVKTTGSTASGEIKTKIGDGVETWDIIGGLDVQGNITNVDSLKHTYNIGTDGDTIQLSQNTYILLGDSDGTYYIDTTGYDGQARLTLYSATSDTTTIKLINGDITAFSEFGGSDSLVILRGNGMFKEYQYQDGIFKLLSYSHNLYTGWAEYADSTYTEGSPLSLSAGNKVTLPNDAGGVRDDQIPIDIDSLYQAADTTITGRNGDAIGLTIEFKAKPTTASVTKLTVTIDLGGAVGEIYPRDFIMSKGNGVEHYYISSFGAYTLDTWESNGGQVKIVSDAVADIYDIRYVINRAHKAR